MTILLEHNQLSFRFPDLPEGAELRIDLQRTLRLPDDGQTYPLPPGLGRFPLRTVDEHSGRVPDSWRSKGGVMLPLRQAEALWIRFETKYLSFHCADYPFAVRVAAGRVNAVTGEPWMSGLRSDPQSYLVVPPQPWLDGFCVEAGRVQQFVAMPLGAGYTAEEQLHGRAEAGGLQIEVVPMRPEAFVRHHPWREPEPKPDLRGARFALSPSPGEDPFAMGLAAGGSMRQEIHSDPYELADWDQDVALRCHLHLVHASSWRALTGEEAPGRPPTAKEYSEAGLPWFDHYAEPRAPVRGSGLLALLKSVVRFGAEKGEQPLPENESCAPRVVVPLGGRPVRSATKQHT